METVAEGFCSSGRYSGPRCWLGARWMTLSSTIVGRDGGSGAGWKGLKACAVKVVYGMIRGYGSSCINKLGCCSLLLLYSGIDKDTTGAPWPDF